ncbi:hypothetical protein GCM10022219_23300 [Microbacterium oryzae]
MLDTAGEGLSEQFRASARSMSILPLGCAATLATPIAVATGVDGLRSRTGALFRDDP